MPGSRRKKKGQTETLPGAQIKEKGPSGGGPDNYDETANTNAGTPPEKKLEVEGPGRVTTTY